MQEYLVRLKPRNEKKGILLRRFLVFGLRFDVDRGWYKVPEVIYRFSEELKRDEKISVIEYLRKVRNNNDDQDSPLAFDICTPAEARAMDEAERKAKEAEAAKAANPNPVDLVSYEVRRGPREDSEEAPRPKLKGKRGRPRKVPAPAEGLSSKSSLRDFVLETERRRL